MKKLLTLAAAGMLLASAANADEVFGTWKTIPDDNGYYGHVEVAQCGNKICGKLIGSFKASDNSVHPSDNVGKNLIWDMVNEGGGKYGGGKAWSPDRDKTYAGKLVLKGDSLTVKGCVAFICRDGGTWSRVK